MGAYVLINGFTAESLGLPLVQPYLGVRRKGITAEDFEKGLNFAVAGATALDASFLRENMSCKVHTNYSLAVQLEWFRDAYSSVCRSSSTASEFPSLLGVSYIIKGNSK